MRSYVLRGLFLATVCFGVLVLWASPAQAADPVDPQSGLNPGVTYEPEQLPTPQEVPGKEYSNDPDRNAAGELDPGQVIRWEGDGTTIWDTFDYVTDVSGPGTGVSDPTLQVDALANIRDLYFKDLNGERWYDGAHVGDTVSLLCSFGGNTTDIDANRNIYYSRSSFRDGSTGVWAEWDTNINGKDTNGNYHLQDVDGLEIWGPDQDDDANMYSRATDPDPQDGGGRTSVFRYHPESDTSVPYLRTQVLLDVVIDDAGHNPDWDTTWAPTLFDVDAMMIWDINNDDVFGADTTYGGIYGNDVILFSVRPIVVGGVTLFDGGEIWVYEFDPTGVRLASFLVHGELDNGDPRVWNTAHNVSQHFFGDTAHSENIDALEALPEPGTFGLMGLGALAVGFFRFRRFRMARR